MAFVTRPGDSASFGAQAKAGSSCSLPVSYSLIFKAALTFASSYSGPVPFGCAGVQLLATTFLVVRPLIRKASPHFLHEGVGLGRSSQRGGFADVSWIGYDDRTRSNEYCLNRYPFLTRPRRRYCLNLPGLRDQRNTNHSTLRCLLDPVRLHCSGLLYALRCYTLCRLLDESSV